MLWDHWLCSVADNNSVLGFDLAKSFDRKLRSCIPRGLPPASILSGHGERVGFLGNGTSNCVAVGNPDGGRSSWSNIDLVGSGAFRFTMAVPIGLIGLVPQSQRAEGKPIDKLNATVILECSQRTERELRKCCRNIQSCGTKTNSAKREYLRRDNVHRKRKPDLQDHSPRTSGKSRDVKAAIERMEAKPLYGSAYDEGRGVNAPALQRWLARPNQVCANRAGAHCHP